MRGLVDEWRTVPCRYVVIPADQLLELLRAVGFAVQALDHQKQGFLGVGELLLMAGITITYASEEPATQRPERCLVLPDLLTGDPDLAEQFPYHVEIHGVRAESSRIDRTPGGLDRHSGVFC